MNGRQGLRPDKWMVALVVSGAIVLGSLSGAAWATPGQNPSRQTVPTLGPSRTATLAFPTRAPTHTPLPPQVATPVPTGTPTSSLGATSTSGAPPTPTQTTPGPTRSSDTATPTATPSPSPSPTATLEPAATAPATATPLPPDTPTTPTDTPSETPEVSPSPVRGPVFGTRGEGSDRPRSAGWEPLSTLALLFALLALIFLAVLLAVAIVRRRRP
jgi:disulfide bond formation protein DsbB